MKIGVFGPRDHKGQEYKNFNYVSVVLDEYSEIGEIVTGGGRGVEQLALRYAVDAGLEHDVIPPNIAAYGKGIAFVRRNEEIIKRVDLCILIWDGKDAMYVEFMKTVMENQKRLHVYPIL